MKLLPLDPEDWFTGLQTIKDDLGAPLNIHGLMANHPELLLAWMPFRNHVVGLSSLPPRHRELLILRTAYNCKSDYEWRHHVVRGHQAGLTATEIERVKAGPGAQGWRPEEAGLLNAADDCHRQYRICDATLTVLNRHFDNRQLLDIVATIGMYVTLALFISSFEVADEHD